MAPKLFSRNRRICQTYFVVFGEYSKTIEAYMENTRDSHLFALRKVVSKYVKIRMERHEHKPEPIVNYAVKIRKKNLDPRSSS